MTHAKTARRKRTPMQRLRRARDRGTGCRLSAWNVEALLEEIDPKPEKPKLRKFHWWKCQKCGVVFERVTSSEPRRCPMCLDRGVKSYCGYKTREE